MTKAKHPEHELIVVFKKNVPEDQSIEMVTSWNVEFRSGMDSSKGRIYFTSTGKKYILTFNTEEELDAFEMNDYQFLPEIHQIYTPNWDRQKD